MKTNALFLASHIYIGAVSPRQEEILKLCQMVVNESVGISQIVVALALSVCVCVLFIS